ICRLDGYRPVFDYRQSTVRVAAPFFGAALDAVWRIAAARLVAVPGFTGFFLPAGGPDLPGFSYDRACVFHGLGSGFSGSVRWKAGVGGWRDCLAAGVSRLAQSRPGRAKVFSGTPAGSAGLLWPGRDAGLCL